jgi:hypothetical protein
MLNIIDKRSPLAGLYVRLERLYAKLVWDEHDKASTRRGSATEDPILQWRRLRDLLAQISLMGCAKGGREMGVLEQFATAAAVIRDNLRYRGSSIGVAWRGCGRRSRFVNH